jgi:dihydroorotate dehydrogenase electron transfer subunit
MQKPGNTPQDCYLVLNSKTMGGSYHLIRLDLPRISHQACPGDLIEIEGKNAPIMRNNKPHKWLEILITDTQTNWLNNTAKNLLTTLLTEHRFQINEKYSYPLLIGHDSGMAAIIFLAETLKKEYKIIPTVLFEFSGDLPFRPHPSQIMTPTLPAAVIATMPMLEDWSIPCRIAHNNALPGCYDGNVIELAEHLLKRQKTLEQVSLYACGKSKMIESVSKLAQRFSVPYQTIEIN